MIMLVIGHPALTALMCLHSRPFFFLLNLKSGHVQFHCHAARRVPRWVSLRKVGVIWLG